MSDIQDGNGGVFPGSDSPLRSWSGNGTPNKITRRLKVIKAKEAGLREATPAFYKRLLEMPLFSPEHHLFLFFIEDHRQKRCTSIRETAI